MTIDKMHTDKLLELSDLIVDFDPLTLTRRNVSKQAIVEQLLQVGDKHGAAIVQRMPENKGHLDPDYVDRLLVRVHCEMQRMSEEFQHGRRVLELLIPLLNTLRIMGERGPYRVVDIGCGTGYVLRWLAKFGRFEDVELYGVDFNQALIREATRLSEHEQLNCRFLVANAFTMDDVANIYISTGVIHHFRGDEGLANFFRQHDRPATHAFLHFDFQPTILARPGSWLFHYVRMREPLARHDGVISARRAHDADVLLRAARQTNFRCGMYSTRVWKLPIPRVFHTLVGIRPILTDAFQKGLGRRAARMEGLK